MLYCTRLLCDNKFIASTETNLTGLPSDFGNFMCAFSKILSQQTNNDHYSYDAKIASHGYHVYLHGLMLRKAMKYKLRLKQRFKVNPYACTIRVKGKYFDVTETVGHIPREVS